MVELCHAAFPVQGRLMFDFPYFLHRSFVMSARHGSIVPGVWLCLLIYFCFRLMPHGVSIETLLGHPEYLILCHSGVLCASFCHPQGQPLKPCPRGTYSARAGQNVLDACIQCPTGYVCGIEMGFIANPLGGVLGTAGLKPEER